ncbi:YdgA family protein [Marinimicrococcus flavescens]|uniref:DUF945 domain-containing protein n=1 Tax=Marinimicrococcus flavescens TaxID=3031815 RepID=A0AAP4D7F3_9PROT|nr:hypothetical protein [Marinimicrococcus flavescens]
MMRTETSRAPRLLALVTAGLLLGAAPVHADPATAERLREAAEADIAALAEIHGEGFEVSGKVTVEEDPEVEGAYVGTAPALTWPVHENVTLTIPAYETRIRDLGDGLFEVRWDSPVFAFRGHGEAAGQDLALSCTSQDNSARYDISRRTFLRHEQRCEGAVLAKAEGGPLLTIARLMTASEQKPEGDELVAIDQRMSLEGLELSGEGRGMVRIGRLEAVGRATGLKTGFMADWQKQAAMMRNVATAGEWGELPAEGRAEIRDGVLAILSRDMLAGGSFAVTLHDLAATGPGQPGGSVDRLGFGMRGGAGEEPRGVVLDYEMAGIRTADDVLGDIKVSLALRDVPSEALIESIGELMMIEPGPGAEAGAAAIGQGLLQQVVAAGTAFELRDLRLARPGASLAGQGRVRGAADAALGAVMQASLSLEGIEALEAEFGGSEDARGIFAVLRAFGQPAGGGGLDYVFALDEAGQLTVNQRDLLPIIGLLMQDSSEPPQGPQRRAATR